MNSVHEFLVHFGSFRNVDLYRQGMYRVRASVYAHAGDDAAEVEAAERGEAKAAGGGSAGGDGPPVKRAMPYHMPAPDEALREAVAPSRAGDEDVPAAVDLSAQTFMSRAFRVQYCEQEEALEDACLFRLEVRASERMPVMVDVELMFGEYSSADQASGRARPPAEAYESVCKRTLVMQNVFAEGVHALYPTTFDDSHFCMVDVMVHSVCADFRFRPVVVARPAARRGLNPITGRAYERPPPVVARTLEEFIFRRRVVPAPLRPSDPPDAEPRMGDVARPYTPQEVAEAGEKHHRFYVQSLALAYNGLATSLRAYLRAFIPEELRQTLTSDFSLRPLVLDEGVAVAGDDALKGAKAKGGGGGGDGGGDDDADDDEFPYPKLVPMAQRLAAAGVADSVPAGMAEVARVIAADAAAVARQTFALWNVFYEVVPKLGRPLVRRMHEEWARQTAERYGGYVFREVSAPEERWKVADTDLADVHAHVSSVVRRAAHLASMVPLSLVDLELVVEPEYQTVLFDETYDATRFAASDGAAAGKPGISAIDGQHFSADGGGGGGDDDGDDDDDDGDDDGDDAEEQAKRGAMLRDAAEAAARAATGAEAAGDDAGGDNAAVVSALSLAEVVADPGALLADHSPRKGSPPEIRDVEKFPAAGGDDCAADAPAAGEPEAAEAKSAAGGGSPASPRAAAYDEAAAIAARRAKYRGKHVVVLVHGYQGNSWDMRLFKNRLAVMFPSALYLLSAANEGETEGDIDDMGVRLAREVDEFVLDNCRTSLGRLSFVAHSLGGVIVRAALRHPLMAGYLPSLYNLVTLATPHCGYMYSDNSLLDTGIWVLKKWMKSVCLSQLSMTDDQDPTKTFMYRLSEARGLEHFEHVLALASQQDKYAPFHSARMELHDAATKDRKKGAVFCSMVNNLLAPLDGVVLKRIDVSFVHLKKNLDSFIGRTAHIYFLDQELYMHILLHVYKEYFR